ncbi:hypothetical protein GUITHDRAFT_134270 [Guillardia theta CCMP2712]|uniref:tRNA/rRNA methyltransferase SpoU type domain-containing protein n=1 Tax=Guillardia theta (strain CCMP2712) TaxID=905079 RepID=L1JTR6_GUITC|nr:hypothetical protein GUITHDRAFT_134270 [Guillardia theta CCMP2712]EKX51956.1 hypothetical protein GUITHDRAFT_134270 [Guillardia theta CCMP2712]|eukprot:XP_005838936.1 hypothetical protein GUITHDRAFT_134270 [Guillardia theta CCMP2712]
MASEKRNFGPVVTSLQNAVAKRLVKLLVLVEEDQDLWHQDLIDRLSLPPTTDVIVVSPDVFRKISGLETTEGRQVLAEIGLPEQCDLRTSKRIIVLDRIQDPGNLGTLLRTAAGLGWDAALLLDGCSDPFNEKAIRAARGAQWRLGVCYGDTALLKEEAAAAGKGSSLLLPLLLFCALPGRCF